MPAPPTSDDLLLIGRAVREHGVHGELKVVPETDDPERFEAIETVFVGKTPETARPRAVRSVRYQTTKRGLLVVLALEGVETREAAQGLRGHGLYADAADLPPLEDDELYLHDLIGLRAETEDGESVGTVVDVLETPAHLTFRIQRPGREDALVPAVPAFVAEMDVEAGRLVLTPIEGLL